MRGHDLASGIANLQRLTSFGIDEVNAD